MSLFDGVIFCCLLVTAGQAADNPPNLQSASDKGDNAARMEHMKQAAQSYRIALAPDAAKKLILIEEPVLRFADHVTGVVDGTVFVWMMDDRPGAIASVWIQKSGYEFHEFQSLAGSPLIASNQGQPKWTPAEPGIERKPAPVTQPSAATAARRLNQMRTLAREYTATVTDKDNNRQVLRVLSQPVYRYGRSDGDVADGAIFAFCKGTNPEVLLLLEAVKNGNELQWKYAFARMSARGCEVRRDDKVVWSAPLLRRESPTDPYFNVLQRYTGPGVKGEPTPGHDK